MNDFLIIAGLIYLYIVPIAIIVAIGEKIINKMKIWRDEE